MDNFKIIYKLLKTLESFMDIEEIDKSLLSAEVLGINEIRFAKIMKMLVDNGYVQGVGVVEPDNYPVPIIKLVKPAITLRGLEYLHENSFMQKAARLAKGIKDTIPGI